MAGLLDIFGTGGTETLSLLGMSPAEIQRNRDDAQAQALYGLAARLFQGGNTGQSIAEGLQQGQKLYSAAMQNQLQDQLQGFQLKDMLEKRKREKQAEERQALIDKAITGAYRPAVAAVEPPTPTGPLSGAAFGEVGTPAQEARFDLQAIAPALMATPQGRATLADLVKAQEAMQPKLQTLKPGEQLGFVQNGKFTSVAELPKDNLTTDYSNWVLAGKPGTFQSWLTARQKPLIIMNQGQKGFENTTDLKKQFGAEPIYKEFAGMQTAYSQVTNAIKQGTPIGDTAAATKIMKLLDPSSVVRETELGMAMAATGKMDRLQNYLDLYISGKKLTPTQRNDFQSLADQLYNAAAVAYNNKRGEYEQIGKGFNLNTDLALGQPVPIMAKPSGGGDLASQAAAELAKRREKKP